MAAAGRGHDDHPAPEAITSSDAPTDPPAARARDGGPLRPDGDILITITDIRQIFQLGRTAAYGLTRRPGFLDPVRVTAVRSASVCARRTSARMPVLMPGSYTAPGAGSGTHVRHGQRPGVAGHDRIVIYVEMSFAGLVVSRTVSRSSWTEGHAPAR
jgi:hypothetical protein